ncbi:hypothetical protein OSJ77_09370 [Phyllobacterium sp. 0TCS1.6C]|uniref:hypothetical protein n=1 Tax=unclassified Phyllobacterium TaxID=2638441 RepID=UPI002265310A|nr:MULTISPECIES: hypothetical protein [unclassified Phyllobacterium]MCX8280400.1 hypothetical protein [Phyllobacterium sp. 0TCS1.6C]MCX8295151.1 hypothetical protein [Phyllobacterium sp. 0TCS1.6A]
MRAFYRFATLILASLPVQAVADPFVSWNSNEAGFWLEVDNQDDRNWACTVEYRVTVSGKEALREHRFLVAPKSRNIVFVPPFSPLPRGQWSFAPEGRANCT